MSTDRIAAWIVIFLVGIAARAAAQDPVPLYPENYRVLLENERVRVLDFRLARGAREDAHAHPAHVVYVLAPFRIRFAFPDGRTGMREAKASGLPIIVPDEGGASDQFVEGQGARYKARSASALAAAIAGFLAGDPDGARWRATAAAGGVPTMEAHFETLFALYAARVAARALPGASELVA